MCKKEMIAMILAGGQGSRLKALTKNVAKPAVPFGGKYRIIDFALSNCANSGIDTVGVLTQYKPLELSAHIGIGSPWDLDRRNGGVSILPPYETEAGGKWYRGTANAIYQNISFIDNYDPDYVLILSGDHIYKMDYSKMLEFHKKSGAEATISVINVSEEEASRFGIMNTNEDMSIYEFQEKPKVPKSTLASMGIYIFNWKTLRKYLKEDELDELSSNDFGKNIIPKMINGEVKMMAYPFEGYWKDVGTIESLWEANMDLLKQDNKLNLYDQSWPILSKSLNYPSQYIGMNAEVKNSMISEGAKIEGSVINSLIFEGAEIGENVIIRDSVIMPNAKVGNNSIINRSIIATGVEIGEDVIIGDGENINLVAEDRVKAIGYVEERYSLG